MFKLGFFAELRFFLLTPHFDQDAFMHCALYELAAPLHIIDRLARPGTYRENKIGGFGLSEVSIDFGHIFMHI